MTAILQLSDTHLAHDGQMVSGRLRCAESLEQLVARVQSALPHWGRVDAVLVTGDISDDGSADSYDQLKKLLAPLSLPVFVIPGNHDARETMRSAFLSDGYLPPGGPLNWRQQIGDVTLIGIDTLVEGSGHGRLMPETLKFLREALQNAQPSIVALHHPPFRTGIEFMDAIDLVNADEFADAIDTAIAEVRVVCGHIHSMAITSIGRHVAVSAPSTCSTFELNLCPEAPVGFYDRPDGCLLHRWLPGFQTHFIGASTGAGPFPF